MEVQPGETVTLVAGIDLEEGAPLKSPVEYQWSTTGGTLSKTSGAAVDFTAPGAGRATVTVEVTAGDGAYLVAHGEFRVIAPVSEVTETPSPSLTSTFTPVQTTVTPVPTTATIPPPEDVCILKAPEIQLNWDIYTRGGSTIVTSPASGIEDGALMVSYDLKPVGWAGIARDDVDTCLFTEGSGLEFTYMGSGEPNTMELKLIYSADRNEACFSVQWGLATDTNGDWVTLQAPYTAFKCWVDTGCAEDEELDPSKVEKIDLAFSNKEGDKAGKGEIIIDNVKPID